MSWKNNKESIITNLIQQAAAIIIFLVVPNFLTVENYGQVVFVGVLLSFTTFSDLGLSLVYGRIMPAIYKTENLEGAKIWNQTTFSFKFYTGMIFGFIIGLIYFNKYAF